MDLVICRSKPYNPSPAASGMVTSAASLFEPRRLVNLEQNVTPPPVPARLRLAPHLLPRRVLQAIFVSATITLSALLIVVLFEPGLSYEIHAPVPAAAAPAFIETLAGALDQSALVPGRADLLADGAHFYPAELAQIAGARASIHLEAFIFHQTPIGQRFLDALTERARAGIKVRVVVDAIGSLPTADRFFDPLRAAGAQVVWYQPFRWYTLKRWNNRTHRELLIVDGNQAWIGGAGIGSAWDSGTRRDDIALPPWRDLMVHVDGATAHALQAVFAQSWLEASGEILVGSAMKPLAPTALPIPSGSTELASTYTAERAALVIGSAPTGGRATRARTMFALLVAAARQNIWIDSPYFVPDLAMRRALVAAATRGVRVTAVVPGQYNNHTIARLASRRHYGELLQGGVHLLEYQPGMIHTKLVQVDDVWSAVGSTNFDNRSFGLNNEVNLLLRDAAFAAQFEPTKADYRAHSREISFAEWQQRSAAERALAWAGSILERQE